MTIKKKILVIGLLLVFAALLGPIGFVVLASSYTTVDAAPAQLPAGRLDNAEQANSGNGVEIAAAASITLTEIIDSSAGLVGPVDIANAGDGRLFIVEKEGRIRIYNGTALLPTPFLDITALAASQYSEAGLIGLAFHPDYVVNGYFYVNYIHELANSALVTRVARYQVSAGNANVANPASGIVLLQFAQDRGNHNGGDLSFGPNDGYLYISSGDGGTQGDPQDHGQTDTQLLGKILRIDVDGTGGADCDTSGGSNYDIPPGNPLADGSGGNCDEIWSNGLRNPWRFSFDRATADMWIADVGFKEWEEINFQPAASPGEENWGWRCYEGNAVHNTAGCGALSSYDFPVYAYAHDDVTGECSVTGGFVYRGTAVPALTGHYLFVDFCSRNISSLSGSSHTLLTSFGLPNVVGGAPFYVPTTFGEDVNGELYIAENGTNASVFKITDVVVPSNVTQAISPFAGWNIVSSFVEPDDPALETLLADIEEHMVLMKNGDGEVYWPALAINNIGDWDVRDGYQIYMNDPFAVLIPGQQAAPAQTPINLPAGWSMVAYLRDNPLPPDQALAGISAQLLLAKNDAGEVYWPAYGIDQIGEMKPGEGYQLYLDSSGVLTYPAN